MPSSSSCSRYSPVLICLTCRRLLVGFPSPFVPVTVILPPLLTVTPATATLCFTTPSSRLLHAALPASTFLPNFANPCCLSVFICCHLTAATLVGVISFISHLRFQPIVAHCNSYSCLSSSILRFCLCFGAPAAVRCFQFRRRCLSLSHSVPSPSLPSLFPASSPSVAAATFVVSSHLRSCCVLPSCQLLLDKFQLPLSFNSHRRRQRQASASSSSFSTLSHISCLPLSVQVSVFLIAGSHLHFFSSSRLHSHGSCRLLLLSSC